MRTITSTRYHGLSTLLICFAIALFEGFDLQSVGIAASRIARHFSLNYSQVGWVFTVSSLGMLLGAAAGGRIADRLGRKLVLITSVALFGVFSIATAHVWDYHSLLAARLLTGLGLGAAMPNLIALCSEAVPAERRGSAIGLMYSGLPFGAALASLVGVVNPSDTGWKDVFYIGGLGPVFLIPALMYWLSDSAAFQSARRRELGSDQTAKAIGTALWGEGRAATTLSLWVGYLGALTVFYFLLNWLPSLAIGKGLSAANSAWVQVLFHTGGTIGAMAIGRLMDGGYRQLTTYGTFAGIVISLWLLAGAQNVAWMVAGGFLAGMLFCAAQSLLYSLTGLRYPVAVRGTGVGASVAVGRIGSVVGPFAAGQLLSHGFASATLIVACIPLIAVAAFATSFAAAKPEASD